MMCVNRSVIKNARCEWVSDHKCKVLMGQLSEMLGVNRLVVTNTRCQQVSDKNLCGSVIRSARFEQDSNHKY